MERNSRVIAICVRPSQLLRGLIHFTIFLIIADLAVLMLKEWSGHDVAKGLIPFFNMDNERNLPTLFSTGLWLLSALFAFDLGRNTTSGRYMKYGWFGLVAIFVFLGIDEFSVIHEHATRHVKDNVLALKDASYAWILPYLVFGLLVGLSYLKFLFRLPPGPRYTIILAGAVFVTGAAGLEFVAYSHKANTGQTGGVVWGLVSTLEESMELAGLLLLITALLGLKTTYRPRLFSVFSSRDPGSRPRSIRASSATRP